MPRVSEAHVAQRRKQIVDAAQRCFVRLGFAATSVSDIVRESGLSTGAVYSYFGSKNALVEAVVRDASLELVAGLDHSVGTVVAALVAAEREHGHARLVAQIWGLAAVDPGVAATARATRERTRDGVAAIVAEQRAAGSLPCDVRTPSEVADAFLALCTGLNLQLAVGTDVDEEAFVAALEAVLRG